MKSAFFETACIAVKNVAAAGPVSCSCLDFCAEPAVPSTTPFAHDREYHALCRKCQNSGTSTSPPGVIIKGILTS